MLIEIYEGERELCSDNHFLGEFEVKNIPPGKAGEVQIKINLEVDEEGCLKVTTDKSSAGMTVGQNTNRLSEDEIARMCQDAEKFREADKLKSQRNEAKCNLMNYCYKI